MKLIYTTAASVLALTALILFANRKFHTQDSFESSSLHNASSNAVRTDTLIWNASSDRELGSVAWPEDNLGTIWYYDLSHHVKLLLPNGDEKNITFDFAQVWRAGDTIRGFVFVLQGQDLESAYSLASHSVDLWNDPHKMDLQVKLKNWYELRKKLGFRLNGTESYNVEVGTRHGGFYESVTVSPSYDRDAPWRIMLTFNFTDVVD